MAASTKQTGRSAAGDPLSDLLDDTDMRRASSRARPRGLQRRRDTHAGVWWVAAAASLVWIASVLAFSWSRYALPSDPGSVFDAAKTRLETLDWLLIGCAIVGPLLLIWVIAWLIRRSMELRDDSRRLGKAAILLADAAEAAEQRAEQMALPAARNAGPSMITGTAPNHLHREIERATHAMSALQTQMSAMEEALSRQAAAFDDAAERTAARVQSIRDGTRFAAIPDGRPTETLIVEDDPAPVTVVGDNEAGLIVTAGAVPVSEDAAIDLALTPDAPSRAETLRAGLKAAADAATWKKLADDTSGPNTGKAETETPKAGQPKAEKPELEDIRRDIKDIQKPSAALDPFDDIVSSTGTTDPEPDPVIAALGPELSFGADRSDAFESPIPSSRLDAVIDNEPSVFPPKAARVSTPSSDEDFEFMARALDWEKFVRAANFPESERDTETLDALYDVLTDPEAASLLQSAEDTLATLADLDLYMEDFVPEMSPVSAWRAHLDGKKADGEESRLIGIDAAIEQSRIDAKLSSDDDFAKLAERFAERFTIVMKRLFAEAGDDRLALDFADSRTGRAYLLLARPLGRL